MTNRPNDLAVERRASRWATFYAPFDTLLQQRPMRPAKMIEGEDQPLLCERRNQGLQSVPIYKIITTAPRFGMFDYWLAENTASSRPRAEQPTTEAYTAIELYKLGDVYFVKGGTQRVAQARLRGRVFLPAQVSEYVFNLSQNGHTQLYELLLREEQHAFFETTHLAHTRPEQQIICSTLGNYQLLLRQIDAYRAHVAGTSSAVEATLGWYDAVYAPVVESIHKQHLDDYFPTQSATDLFLWATTRAALACHAGPLVPRFAILKQLATLRRALRHARTYSEHSAN